MSGFSQKIFHLRSVLPSRNCAEEKIKLKGNPRVRSQTWDRRLTEVPINISKWTLTARFSQHPSVSMCYRILMAGIAHPLPLIPANNPCLPTAANPVILASLVLFPFWNLGLLVFWLAPPPSPLSSQSPSQGHLHSRDSPRRLCLWLCFPSHLQ